MTTDPLDLVDPIRLVIMLLPERYRAPVGAALSLAAASQGIAAGIVSRLPLSAREHPRWGWLVRALGWWSVLRFRDELGTTKLPGGAVGARVTLAPDAPVEHDTPPDGDRHASIVPPAPSFDPTRRLRRSDLPPVDGGSQSGHASIGPLVMVLFALGAVSLAGALLTGCPRMPPASGCQPEAQTCIADSPHVCSASQRWHRAGALTCSQVGGVCAVVGGRAYCAAPVADAGVSR